MLAARLCWCACSALSCELQLPEAGIGARGHRDRGEAERRPPPRPRRRPSGRGIVRLANLIFVAYGVSCRARAAAALHGHQAATRPQGTWVPRFPAQLGGKLGAGTISRRTRAICCRTVASDRERQILARVRAIPVGFVRTYGDVSPGAPRVAGAVLHACDDPRIPWHRVVRADGTLAKGERQRSLLERRGRPVPRFARRSAGSAPPRSVMWVQREIDLRRAARAAFISSPARSSAPCPSWATSRSGCCTC